MKIPFTEIKKFIYPSDPFLTAEGRHGELTYEEAPILEEDLMLCMDMLKHQIKMKGLEVKLNNYYRMNLTSLELKQFIEDLFAKKNRYRRIVSHGAVILALILLGIQFKRYKNYAYVRTINLLVDEEKEI